VREFTLLNLTWEVSVPTLWRVSPRGALVFVCIYLCCAAFAVAQVRPAVSSVPNLSGSQSKVRAQQTSCPNYTGILDSISVPVKQIPPLTLYVVISSPAPEGGATFELESEDATIAAAGDPTQANLPQVFIPEGETVSNAFVLYGVSVGKTNLDIIPQTAGFAPSSTPTTAWDLNPSADPNIGKLLDANPPDKPCRASGSDDLSTDPSVVSTCGKPAMGVVSDGVSALLMEVKAGLQGTACYDITSTGPPDQGDVSTAVTDTQPFSGYDYGISYYEAPDGYGNTSQSRQVQLTVSFAPSIGNGNTTSIKTSLTVVRTPLLLIHGLWSDPSAWPTNIWQRQPSAFYFVNPDTYENSNGANFSKNAPTVKTFVSHTLQKARSAHYAATQVDVVAHSMGGILSRLYIESDNNYRVDNLDEGDIHRLITLDTPHFGSSFANLLVNLYAEDASDTVKAVHDLVKSSASVVNGAVCDLSENSTGLEALDSDTDIPAQTFSATGGPLPGSFDPATDEAQYWEGVLYLGAYRNSFEERLTRTTCKKRSFVPPFKCLDEEPIFNQKTVNDFRFLEDNDAIVGQASQDGDVSEGETFAALIHFGADTWYGVHVAGITNTQQVANDVFSALDGDGSDFDDSFPTVSSDGTGNASSVTANGNSTYTKAYGNECVTGTHPMNPAPAASSPSKINLASAQATTVDSGIRITSPANGQVFAPGDTVSINVSLPATLQVNDFDVDVPGLDDLEGTNYNGSSFRASLVIPDTFAGPLTLTPGVTDVNNNPIQGVSIGISVRPPTAPQTLILTEQNFFLVSVTDTARLHVQGIYSNGIKLDLTSSASGTTYSSNNPNVLSVDTEGNVQAKQFGTAVVTVQNGGVRTFATFAIENPASPLPPQDMTGSIAVTSSGFRVDRNTGFFVQTVQLTNSSLTPLIGPLYFVIAGLPSGVSVVNSGTTVNISPVGSPYLTLSPPNGVTLQPGASVGFIVEFLDPSRARIAYTPKVFRTSSAP